MAGRTRCPGPRRAYAVLVRGNRDIGPCHRVEGRARARYPAAALDHLAALRLRLVVGECHFSHVEPSVDPYDAPDEPPHSESLTACQAFAWKASQRRQSRSSSLTAQQLPGRCSNLQQNPCEPCETVAMCVKGGTS